MKRFSFFVAVFLLALSGCNSAPLTSPDNRAATPTDDGATNAVSTSVHFTDITKAAGINFTHINGAFGERMMPESVGSGAAFLDYDGDGYQDIFLVNSRDWTKAEIEAYKAGNNRKPRRFNPRINAATPSNQRALS